MRGTVRHRRGRRERGGRMGLLAILTGLAVGCAGDDAATGGQDGADATDGGTDGAAEVGDLGQTLVLPEPPRLTPCPPGWREVPPAQAGDPAHCDPWPEGGRQACGIDAAHFPGSPGCVRLGSACAAADDWATDLPAGPLVFVHPGATAGGAGTREAPLATLGEALALASPGTTIALGRGHYDEQVEIPAGLTLWGACVAETTVGSSVPPAPEEPGALEAASLRVLGAGVTLRNLRLVGARPNVFVTAGASLTLRDAVIEVPSFLGYGVGLSGGATLTATDVAIRGVAGEVVERTPIGIFSGLSRDAGGISVTLARVELVRLANGVTSFGGELDMADVALLDPLLVPGLQGEPYAIGVSVFEGGQAVVRRSVFACFPTAALVAAGDGTVVRVEDAMVVGGAPGDPACQAGPGLLAVGGASLLELARVSVLQPRWAGLASRGGGALIGTDVIVAGVHGESVAAAVLASDSSPRSGRESVAELTRVHLVDSHGAGLLATNEASLTATDLVIRQTGQLACEATECERGPLGIGLSVQGGATLRIARFELADSALCGLQVASGVAELDQGVILRNVVGVNIQDPAYDLGVFARDVQFVENCRDLDVDVLPVPDSQALLRQLP